MKHAKTKMYNLFIGYVCLPGLEMDWKDVVFRTAEPNETQHDLEALKYESKRD
jgi:hypothetical protein